VYIGVLLVGLAGGYYKIEARIAAGEQRMTDIDSRLDEVKQVNPILLQYQVNELVKKVDKLDKQVTDIYRAVVPARDNQ